MPCIPGTGSPYDDRRDMTPWNPDPRAPLCSERYTEPSVATLRSMPGHELLIEVKEITDVLQCQKTETVTASLDGERMNERMRQMTPQEMCNCAAQGEELFQLRSIVLGDTALPSKDATELLHQLFSRAPGVDDALLGRLAAFAGKVAFAQAEYYYDDARAKRAEWLWHMKWKARLRRVHMAPSGWTCPVKGKNSCPASDASRRGPARQLFESLQTRMSGAFDQVVAH